MFCKNCGKSLKTSDKFCSWCGIPIIQMRVCPQCQNKLTDNALYCEQCGTKVGRVQQTVPKRDTDFDGTATGYQANFETFQKSNVQTNMNMYQNFDTQPAPAFNSQQCQKYRMISKYEGEPTVGIAKSTGTLAVYSDHIEYTKKMGNALGNISLITMGAAARAEKKKGGAVELYSYEDIQTARLGKYMGLMSAVVLIFKNGQVISFNGTFTTQSANDIINTILRYKKIAE